MLFDFRLRVFYAVAQKLSFTKAAAELYITQPAVTRQIHELEQQLHVRLFNRHGNTISLTTAGEVLVRYAEKILSTYTALETELAQLSSITGGTARIGASTTVAQALMPKVLALFKKAYPAVSFTFMQGNTEFITHQVLIENIDIAIVEGDSQHPQISYSPLARDEIVLVARAQGKIARRHEISPAQLRDIPLVLREQGSGSLEVIYNALAKVHLDPKDLQIETHLESSSGIKQYLMYSDTAAFLSVLSIVDELKRNELAIIDIQGLEISRDFKFIQLHGESSKLTELFKRFCSIHYNDK
jgi:DNA-binding transcriptional LysR family regulator